jgi:hypothetical protein
MSSHRHPLALVTALSILASVACGEEPPLACTDLLAYSVSVQVAATDGPEPEGTTVVFHAEDGVEVPCERFNPGEWACGAEVAGELTVTVSAPGYLTFEQVVTVEADECHVIGESLDVVLEPDGLVCTDEVRPSVEVEVVGSGGEALEAVSVTYAPEGGDDAAPCVDVGGGLWQCGMEEPGTFVVTGTAAGHTTESATVTVGEDECHVITEHVTLSLDWLPD